MVYSLAQIDVVLSGRESISYVKDMTSDFAINMSAIQQQNNEIVAEMLRLRLSANQVALAQRQNLLSERMFEPSIGLRRLVVRKILATT